MASKHDVTDPVYKRDPRTLLVDWANQSEPWVRYAVGLVLNTGRPLSEDDLDAVYALLTAETPGGDGVDQLLPLGVDSGENALPLELVSLSNVRGVNRLRAGVTVPFNPGITILYGENGTGKTGYARILKALAKSRSASVVLPDIYAEETQTPGADITYRQGADERTLHWAGEQGLSPFVGMPVFDSAAVSVHVDHHLAYVYTPASLALFDHVGHALREMKKRLDEEVGQLKTDQVDLMHRFKVGSQVYPLLASVGASSDLEELKRLANFDFDADQQIQKLESSVAELMRNGLASQLTQLQRAARVLGECQNFASSVIAMDPNRYNRDLTELHALQHKYEAFRQDLFSAAALPADPEDTWQGFIQSGQAYRNHLEAKGVHDEDRCLYCRQPLSYQARALVSQYKELLNAQVASDLAEGQGSLDDRVRPVLAAALVETPGFLRDHQDQSDQAPYMKHIQLASAVANHIRAQLVGGRALEPVPAVAELRDALQSAYATVEQEMSHLRTLASTDDGLQASRLELDELRAAVELGRSWAEVEANARRAKRMRSLSEWSAKMPQLSRKVTELSKVASEEFTKNEFERLFAEECRALRAPAVVLKFVGVQSQIQRHKSLAGKKKEHKPSEVLSEGEQKVLALADFIAEARMMARSIPVVFDDPVSSLDHRRISEVAARIQQLAKTNQVVVFTHDMWFAAIVIGGIDRCTYLLVTDEHEKGIVTKSRSPWETSAYYRARINETIQEARGSVGDDRIKQIKEAYGFIRCWCEVFVESELLGGVITRYQPDVKVQALGNIKLGGLSDAIEAVKAVHETACRHTLAHSRAGPSLGVEPTLDGLEHEWKIVQEARKKYSNSGKAR